MQPRVVNVCDVKIGTNNPLVLIAGPCVIESEEIVMRTAEYISRLAEKLRVSFIFKSSFDKANRSSITSYRGPGIDNGLKLLDKVKSSFRVPVITDIHSAEQAMPVSDVADIIQIPAFLCRQTDLLTAAARTKKPVNIKKGQFMAPWDMKNVIDKILTYDNTNILLTERGTSFGYNNLVVDMTSIVEMRKFGFPVIFDATHSVQKPGAMGTTSGGNCEYVKYLAQAATAIGIDGLFLEVHPDPNTALSDGPNMIALNKLEELLVTIMELDRTIKGGI
ncbi:MAG TPA: 3-deoxy-8-phosphooctulonate synthase [Bacillota bacterium]|nr:3-deoxy-8-phosphooctulonate synthase [Bacillota bacterium]HNT02602.1 3-deoxy-8-phosphooctulonate synthase [Bacillota bacterium]HPX68263.1 3-deoxy-8-phosphooctulonate synthase [Bacillota bacterium]HQA65278.1 3-deoxy-8-phosphooctulonate synthase [Bacillota bacterium]HQO41932.1 3-deoxy-8-phosphooctulonate synthase [Bacillota bacterium]